MIFDFEEFRGLMAKYGYTNESLSQALEISHIYVSEYRNGKRQPNINIVNKMIQLFHLENYNILFK